MAFDIFSQLQHGFLQSAFMQYTSLQYVPVPYVLWFFGLPLASLLIIVITLIRRKCKNP